MFSIIAFYGGMSTFSLTDSGCVMMNGSPNLKENDMSGYTFAPLSRGSPVDTTSQLLFFVILYFFVSWHRR